ncbi:MAG TPA: hypothetical protein VMU72_09120 [Gaiellaceae bacterium]|nr:hypothetical protein [Gaiellaceae bacterium]
MSILSTIRGLLTGRDGRQREAYTRDLGNATPEEAAEINERKGIWRFRMKAYSTGGLPEGTGISPTGTPIDFTADEERPKY